MRNTLGLLLLAAACSGGAHTSTNDTPDAASQRPPDAALDAAPSQTRPAGVALCYTPAAENHPATQAFRTALAAGDRNARAAAITGLDNAVQSLPDEEELQLFLGLAHLWRLAEPLPGEDALTTQLTDALGARDHLKTAYQLCPTDARIAAWLGPIQVQMGRKLNNQSTIDEGLMILDQGIAAYPSFVLFSKLLVYADYPRTSPEFQQALDAVLANIDSCNQTPNDPACTNLTVPHNREGGALFLGDVVTKAGLHDDAQAAFTSAMQGADWGTYMFQSTITDRLQQLDARIAAYGDSDASNDPAAAWTAPNQCALCHTH